MGTRSTLAAFVSLDHVSRPWQPDFCDGFEPFVGVSDTPQAVLGERLRIAIKGINVRFATMLGHDRGEARELAVADVGSRPGLVGDARITSESGSVASLAVAPRGALTVDDLDWKLGSSTSLVPAGFYSRARGRMPPPMVSHHA